MSGKTVKKILKSKTKKTPVKKTGSRIQVLRGNAEHAGSLTKKSLKKNKAGKVVSKKKSLASKKNPWILAVKRARKELKITGFQPMTKGSHLYDLAKKYQLEEMKKCEKK